jgi:hypothetical protein
VLEPVVVDGGGGVSFDDDHLGTTTGLPGAGASVPWFLRVLNNVGAGVRCDDDAMSEVRSVEEAVDGFGDNRVVEGVYGQAANSWEVCLCEGADDARGDVRRCEVGPVESP